MFSMQVRFTFPKHGLNQCHISRCDISSPGAYEGYGFPPGPAALGPNPAPGLPLYYETDWHVTYWYRLPGGINEQKPL